MPLHLLGKKSWNVYSQDNVDRVRRDEAAAQAAAQEAENRRLDDEGSDRLAVLRGQAPIERDSQGVRRPSNHKRKREDEWDRASRLAESEYQQQEHGLRTSTNVAKDLIPTPAACGARSEHKSARNSNAEPSFEQLSNMRMIDASGKHKGKSDVPWYHNINGSAAEDHKKDVWGNSDPSRALRNQQRVNASDPLLNMKRGVQQLKELEKKRQAFREERERDLVEVEEMARRRERRERRQRHQHRRHEHESERARHGKDTGSLRRHHGRSGKHRSPEQFHVDGESSRKGQDHGAA